MPDYSDLDPSLLKASISYGDRLKESITTELYTTGTPTAANQIQRSIMYEDGTLKESIATAAGLKASWLLSGAAPVASTGKLLQVARVAGGKVSTTNAMPADNTIPQNTEGVEIMTLAFTPLSATSTLYIDVYSGMGATLNQYSVLALFVDSDADAVAGTSITADVSSRSSGRFLYKVASASTSARTYKVRGGKTSGTFQNYATNADNYGGVAALSWVEIMEVEA